MKFGRFFNPDNMLFRELSHLVDVVGLSLLWLALCIPVVTIGPATAALYHTAVKGLRRGDPATFRRFLRSFRANLKQGIVVTLILLPAVLLLKLGLDIMYTNSGGTLGMAMLAIYAAVLLIPLGAAGYVFPLLGRFAFSTGTLLKTALQLTLAHLPTAMLTALLLAASAAAMGLLVWPVLFLPMLTALAVSFPMEKIFRRYMTEEETDPLADGELR